MQITLTNRLLAATLALGAALVAGCADDEPMPRAPVAPEGRLVVWERIPELPLYREGSVGFLRLVQVESGAVVVDGRVTEPGGVRGNRALFDRRLDAGEYRLVTYQRPCDGNCGYLDPPTARCEARLDVLPGARQSVVIMLTQNGGCTVHEGAQPPHGG